MWFYEKLYPDLEVATSGKLLYKKKTKFQELKIFDTPRLGKVLTLDNITQTTQLDEFIYHEMLVHPVLLSHPNPKNILIIGAGDGGILREVLKHNIKKACLVEIDDEVIKSCSRYMPTLNRGAFKDKRAKIIVTDGAKFITSTKEKFDVAIIDSPDPISVATVLFTKKFYKDVFRVLNNNGLMCRQTGSTMYQPNELGQNYNLAKKIFKSVSIQLAAIPTYVGGFFSFIICSKKINIKNISFKKINYRYNIINLKTRYYNPELHFASRCLPNYIRRNIR